MNIELSTVAIKLLNDLYRTGLYGASPEETARQFVEEGIRKALPFIGLPRKTAGREDAK